ncbi:Leucine-rich repeat-containing protein 27 [Atta colombica]|uniref:Leucine-rich repeat-containing protein 27 n=1 Tax=Atta colombica TaxID=520822 RepID=A0A195BRY7_9HYME|nr:PREDICTED: leucine-rich repeat-containing protein 27-like [Atta colombica]KYM88780.1 Leucine-rich repeat-containing protein 27 [Atta colombica]
MAEDIAVSLLAQYYGISEESETKKFPSIQECVSSIENDSDKLIDEQSTVDTNGDDTSKETEVQENDIENKEKNSEIDTSARSSRALKWEAIEDNETTSSEFDIIFETNAMGNLYENTYTSSGKETHDLTACNKTASTTLGLEDNEENDLYLSLSEDVLLDSASDVSSVAEKKKTAIMFVPPLTPPPNRTPIYNETFVDLTSTGLTSFPIEMLEKYPAIQMLYLENNNLFELPERLFISLQNLQWLDVRNNLLTSLPTTIKSHPSLETILLQGNKIEKLPLELGLVPKLKILNVAHNPITTPPKDIIVLGCSSVLSYLRSEWNKLHPNEPVTAMKQEIEPKASTILCYRSPREKRWKLSKIPRRISKSTNDISDSFKGSAVRKKSKTYKPNNRCEGTGINIVMEQRQQWISKAKDLLSTQSATIQKIKNLDTVKEWRHDKRSFNKSMEKISRRNEDDIPFAIDIEDYPTIQKRSQKAGDYTGNQKQEKLKLVNINQKIQELSGFLQKFEITKSSEILTPKSKQKSLQTEIEKLSHFQKEVHNLRRYNEITSAPMNFPNNLS